MLNLAIPSVAGDLQATVTDAQWFLNAYYVALVSGALVAGSIGDIVGHPRDLPRRHPPFSPQARGGMCPGPGGRRAGRKPVPPGHRRRHADHCWHWPDSLHNPPEERGRAVGQFLGLVAAVPALGPFLSGALIEMFSWRWLFVVPLVLPAIAFVVTRRRVPETPRATERKPNVTGRYLRLPHTRRLQCRPHHRCPRPHCTDSTGRPSRGGSCRHRLRPQPAACRRSPCAAQPPPATALRRGSSHPGCSPASPHGEPVFFVAVMLQTPSVRHP